MSDVNDFDVAKSVSELLKNLDQDRQRLVLRWVAESLHVPVQFPDRVVQPAIERPSAAPLSTTVAPLPRAETQGAVDIKNFVEAKRPSSDIYFAAVVAYYYRFEAPAAERLDSISANILQNATRLAGRIRFTRPLTTLNNAKKQGYLDAMGRGSFRINSVGENLVAMALPSSSEAADSVRRRVRKPKAKPAVSAGEVKKRRRTRG